ncbi:flagellar motor switch protein FliM [Limimaricola pyoseonensis]|uniref:Flagellar motor switch protein FliM n=1 Tax=Limimaricola pyoseonensis TaxID=521013 RepID=A0A1G7KCK5_9RHOB|nr:FliM/FliN family flagellar motor switch protein [Limimaricola pyoseonensis]SDF34902.1 flagellar motor switch protein FliM [Limimaricola pyoseonensis]
MIQRTLRLPEGGLTQGSIEEQIIEMASLSYERLPLLEAIVERYALGLGAAFKSFCGSPCEVTVRSFDYLPCGPALESLPAPALTAVVRVQPWDGRLGLTISPELMFSLLELMLGGRSGPSKSWTPRSFTAIEKRFAERVAGVALRDLENAFETVDEISCRIEHLETSPQNAMLAPPAAAAIRVVLRVTVEERQGDLALVIPDSLIDTVRSLLVQSFPGGEIAGGDGGWRAALSRSITGSEARLTAVLHEVKLELRDVLEWQRGQVLDLGIGMDHEVEVRCSGHAMFRAAIGRRKTGAMALRVTEEIGQGDDEDGPVD